MTRRKSVGQTIADELKQFSRDVKHGKKFMVSHFDPKTGRFVRRAMTIDEVLESKRKNKP